LSTAFTERLSSDVKVAMKAGEKAKLAALRLISAVVKQYEVDKRAEVDDGVAVELLTRMAKQRRESIEQFESAKRDDLVAKEQFELDLIITYLPAPFSADEIEQHIASAINSVGATGMRDMGKVMGTLNGALKGRADMGAVSAQVKGLLGNTP